MIKKIELLKRIQELEDVLTDPNKKYIGSELDIKVDEDYVDARFKLLLNYLGLELITEKSVEYKWEHKYSDDRIHYLGIVKEDYIKYTDKIVKKSKTKKIK